MSKTFILTLRCKHCNLWFIKPCLEDREVYRPCCGKMCVALYTGKMSKFAAKMSACHNNFFQAAKPVFVTKSIIMLKMFVSNMDPGRA